MQVLGRRRREGSELGKENTVRMDLSSEEEEEIGGGNWRREVRRTSLASLLLASQPARRQEALDLKRPIRLFIPGCSTYKVLAVHCVR